MNRVILPFDSLRKRLALAAVVLCLSPASLAQEASISLRGRVLDPSGQPLAGVEALLFPAVGAYERGLLELRGQTLPRPVARAVTDAGGRYRLVLPEAGAWQVQLQGPGWVPVTSLRQVFVEEEWLPTAELREDVGKAVSPPGPKTETSRLFAATPPLDSKVWRGSFWAPRWRYAFLGEQGLVRFPRAEREELLLGAVGPSGSSKTRRQIRLVDTRGGPAAGLLLLVDDQAETLTDEEGKALVPISGSQIVTVLAPGGWRWQLTLPGELPAETQGPISLRLPEIRTLQCRVTDLDGRPLAGALVWPVYNREGVARTDARGEASLPWPGGEVEYLRAAAVGYEPKTDKVAANAKTWALELAPTLAVAGWVVDEEGRPISGARVGTTTTAEMTLDLRRSVETMEDGSFRLPSKDATLPFRLVAQKKGFAPKEQVVLPNRKEAGALRIVLDQGRSLSGHLVDGIGAPIEGARAQLFLVSPSFRRPQAQGEALSDQDGEFRLPNLSLPSGNLLLTASGFAPKLITEILLTDAEEKLDLGEVVLKPARRLSGTVRDSQGRPIEKVRIRVRTGADYRSAGELLVRSLSPESTSVASDANGRFQFLELPALPALTLDAAKPGFQSARRKIWLDDEVALEPVTLVLERGRIVEGWVVDEDDLPVPAADISLRIMSKGSEGNRILYNLNEISDQEGRFESHFDHGDTLSAFAVAGSRASEEHKDLPLDPNKPLHLILKLRQRAVVQGVVEDSAGSPIALATVYLNQPHLATFSGRSLESDAQGRFEFAALPGLATARAQREGLSAAQELTLEEGEVAFVRLILEGHQDVFTGRVVAPNGLGVEDATVEVRTQEEGGGSASYSSTTSATDARGRFQAPVPMTGATLLRVSALGFRPAELPLNPEALPQDELLIELKPGARVHGLVTGLPRQRLAEAVAYAVQENAQSYSEDGRTSISEDGTFVLDGLGEGTWLVVVEVTRLGRSSRQRISLSPGQEEAEVEVHFEEGLTVTGTLRANGRIQPIHRLRLSSASGELFVHTDSEGRFLFEGVGAGPVEVETEFGLRSFQLETDLDLDLDF